MRKIPLKELEKMSDLSLIIEVIEDRKRGLSYYSPLSERLSRIVSTLVEADKKGKTLDELQSTSSTMWKMLSISTAHVSSTTRQWLNEQVGNYNSPLCVHRKEDGCGWFINVPDAVEMAFLDIPSDLNGVITYAQKMGCWYLHMDCDNDIFAGLPTYVETE